MKLIKTILITTLSALLLFIVILLICFFSIKSNLKKLDNEVRVQWEVLFNLSTKKNKVLQVYYLKHNKEIDELLIHNLKNRQKYKNYCQLKYIHMEYLLNKSLINERSGSFDKNNNTFILEMDSLLNESVDKYNNSCLEFNQYYTIFPNVIVGRYLDLKRKKFFTIKYGAINDDPIKKSKEIPEWAVGIDTTFLSK
jgi:hypothetical protein